jgi:hypothetical protein
VDYVDFVPLTVAGQRRTLTGFLYLAAIPNLFFSANFVGCVVGFLNVLIYTPRRLLLAA